LPLTKYVMLHAAAAAAAAASDGTLQQKK
jgi:hypothetical protein